MAAFNRRTFLFFFVVPFISLPVSITLGEGSEASRQRDLLLLCAKAHKNAASSMRVFTPAACTRRPVLTYVKRNLVKLDAVLANLNGTLRTRQSRSGCAVIGRRGWVFPPWGRRPQVGSRKPTRPLTSLSKSRVRVHLQAGCRDAVHADQHSDPAGAYCCVRPCAL